MGKRGDKGRQRVDHGGRYFQWPTDIMSSAAYRSLSHRARCALLEMATIYNGFNNGRIGLSIDNLSAALGNQNHAASSRALGELMDRGFVECMATANHIQSRAREYRLTFVTTGERADQRATHEWRDWKPPARGNMEKIGVEATATRERKPVEPTATQRKFPVEATATRATETRRVGGRFHVEATAAHIITTDPATDLVLPDAGNSYMEVDDLRAALNAYVMSGADTATGICKAIDMPAGTMSKFRDGRGLPERYHGSLQLELGRRGAFTGQPALPVNKIDPCQTGTPANPQPPHPRDNFGGSSEPFPPKRETVPLSAPLEKIGRCTGSPMSIDAGLPVPPWRRILTPDVTRYAALCGVTSRDGHSRVTLERRAS